MEIQGGIDMSVNNVTDAAAFLSHARENVARAARAVNNQTEAGQKKAMEMFGKALRDCDKAMERVMDKHIESVAKSAKELAERRKRKAIAERVKDSADAQQLMNEKIIINRINQRNLLAEIKADDINRRELLER
jgi:histone H3/H4